MHRPRQPHAIGGIWVWIAATMLLAGGRALSQDICLTLWPSSSPALAGPDSTETTDTSDILLIRNIRTPTMSVYLPTRRTATGQAIVVCPGGGYRVLAYDWEGVDIAKWLNANGIAAIVLKYRLPIAFHDSQKHRFALQDAQQAIRLTRQHATEWNISRDKIGVMGFSAGGHVAALLGTRHDCCAAPKGVAPDSTTARPNFMILLYPVVTMARPYAHLGSRSALLGDNPDTIAIQDYSPELHVRNTTPPAFLVHASDDTSVHVENSILFFRALRTHDVPAELHIYHAGGHGFSLATGRRSLHSWTYRCLDWLAQLDSQARDQ